MENLEEGKSSLKLSSEAATMFSVRDTGGVALMEEAGLMRDASGSRLNVLGFVVPSAPRTGHIARDGAPPHVELPPPTRYPGSASGPSPGFLSLCAGRALIGMHCMQEFLGRASVVLAQAEVLRRGNAVIVR